MDNPWTELPRQEPFVLEQDSKAVLASNASVPAAAFLHVGWGAGLIGVYCIGV